MTYVIKCCIEDFHICKINGEISRLQRGLWRDGDLAGDADAVFSEDANGLLNNLFSAR